MAPVGAEVRKSALLDDIVFLHDGAQSAIALVSTGRRTLRLGRR